MIRTETLGRAACASVPAEHKHVSPETFAAVSSRFSEQEICEIVWLVASEHLYNMSNHGLNIGSDGLCDISKRPQSVASAP